MAAGQESLRLRYRDETEFEGLHFFYIGYSTWSHGQVNRTQAQEDIAKNHSCRDRPAGRAILTAMKAGEHRTTGSMFSILASCPWRVPFSLNLPTNEFGGFCP